MFPEKGEFLSGEYTRYFICREMGWDYFTYMSQPSFFIAEILDCIEAEKIARNLKRKSQSNE